MKMRKAPPSNVPPSVNDPTAWLIHGTPADIVLMNTYYIKCMVILAYTFLHGKSSVNRQRAGCLSPDCRQA